MPTIPERSFAGGELAPALYPRTDMSKYATGLRTCRNFNVMRTGGVQNRPGSKFIAEVPNYFNSLTTENKPKLIPFIFSISDTAMLEFGHNYIRVFVNGVISKTGSATAITGISTATAGIVTSAVHGLVNDDQVIIQSVAGMTELNGRIFRVEKIDNNTFYLLPMKNGGSRVNTSTYTAYTSGGTFQKILKIVTSYTYAEVQDLQYVQNADVMTIVHPNHPIKLLSRYGATWTLADAPFGSSTLPVTALTGSALYFPGDDWHEPGFGGDNGQSQRTWYVSSVDTSGNESIAEEVSKALQVDDGSTFWRALQQVGLSWTAPATGGPYTYKVYRLNGNHPPAIGTPVGLIATVAVTTYTDTDVALDLSQSPKLNTVNPFSSTDNYPSVVGLHQDRMLFGATNNAPLTIWASYVGDHFDFDTTGTLTDSSPVTFTISSQLVSYINQLVTLNGKLAVVTETGEFTVRGNAEGVLTPEEINVEQRGYVGGDSLKPIQVGPSIIYLQVLKSILRDMLWEFSVDGYKGNDLTLFSTHLFDGYTILDMAYQETPDSIIWVVRSDGVLLSCTFNREQEMLAWSRHDTDGTVENVCVVPEGTESVVYVTVKRDAHPETQSVLATLHDSRYIERLSNRQFSVITDAIFMDSAITQDGTNTGATTMTLTGAAYTYTDTLTLTSSVAYFTAAMVGDIIDFGSATRFKIEAYTNTTTVTGKCVSGTVPAALRATATATWKHAKTVISGLWNLEGKAVSVIGDGFVVANPNNSHYPTTYTVASGKITLDKPYAVVHVGLPYLSDLETLDIDTAQGVSMVNAKKKVTKVTVSCVDTRGVWAGNMPPTDDDTDPLEGLTELKIRDTESPENPVDLFTGSDEIIIRGDWNHNGRVFIRQVDPLPAKITAVFPDVEIVR